MRSQKAKQDCDRCGFTFDLGDLIKHKGLLVCRPCLDDADPKSKVYWGFYGAQSAGAKTVTDITAAGGITKTEYHMLIQGSGGAVTVTANPRIANGSEDKEHLVLEGNSDTYTVTLANGNGLVLREGKSIILKNGTVIEFVYSSTNTEWTECSRSDFYGNEIKGSYV